MLQALEEEVSHILVTMELSHQQSSSLTSCESQLPCTQFVHVVPHFCSAKQDKEVEVSGATGEPGTTGAPTAEEVDLCVLQEQTGMQTV